MAPAFVALAALPLLRESVYGFTNLDENARRLGAVGLFDRVGILVAGVLAVYAYDLVVRGPDRGVVDVHPVRAAAYVRARLLRIARTTGPILGTALVSLVPLLHDVPLVLGGALLLAGAWAAGLGAGIGVSLGAPALALRPGLAGILDAVRGQNPRAQAALIWAPAVALALSGASVVAGGAGLQAAFAGDPRGYAALLVPWGVAALGARLAFVSGDTLARIPAVLGEVDAAYAAVEEAEEGQRVYLDWLVPRAPAALRPELLRVLRAGWRAERGWLSASFAAALLVFFAGWTADPSLAGRAVAVGGGAVVALGLLGPRIRAHDPAWLVLTLQAPGRWPAMALAIFGWGQAVILPGIAALTLRQGSTGLGAGLRLELLLAAVGCLGARLPLAGYVPVALGLWALGVAS